MTKKIVYGKSNGAVSPSLMDVSVKDLSIGLFLDKTKMSTLDVKIPSDAEIEIRVRYRMRFQRFKCGTFNAPQQPTCTVGHDDRLTIVSNNTVAHANFEVCILSPTEKGHRLAWHEKGRKPEGDKVVEDGSGQSLLQIEVVDFGDINLQKPLNSQLQVLNKAIAFRVEFRETYPVVQVNSDYAELKAEFQRPESPLANIVVPSCLEMILNRLVQDHLCEDVRDMSKVKWQRHWFTWLESHQFVLPERPSSFEDTKNYFEATRVLTEQVINFINTRVDQAQSYQTILNKL